MTQQNLISSLALNKKRKKMFGLFKKKSEKETLKAQYEKLMSEAFKLSQSNRSAGDAKYAEADEIMKKLEAIKD
jgi:hypothetical protein